MKLLKSSKGYTLLEALIAVAIATMVFTSMGYVLSHGFLMSDENRRHLFATNALRKEQENLRLLTYDNFLALGGSSTFTNSDLAKIVGGTGSRTVVNSFGADIKKVTLTVSWTSRNGQALTESFTTYVTRIGINRA